MSVTELGNVQKTLLLPLWGRAVEARKPHPLLIDQAAANIVAAIDYHFSTIARNISFITQLAWIVRCLHTDRTIREFLARHPDAAIVNLGCGLDTDVRARRQWTPALVRPRSPDMVELRKKYIPPHKRRKLIERSLLDDSWIGLTGKPDSIAFIASGVLYYFEEAQVRAFLIRLADAFPGSEIVFDMCSPRGMRMANEKVIKAGGMDENATLKWGLERARDMERWDSRIAVLAEYPLFRGVKRGLRLKEKWGTLMSDWLRIMSMVHLRLG